MENLDEDSPPHHEKIMEYPKLSKKGISSIEICKVVLA